MLEPPTDRSERSLNVLQDLHGLGAKALRYLAGGVAHLPGDIDDAVWTIDLDHLVIGPRRAHAGRVDAAYRQRWLRLRSAGGPGGSRHRRSCGDKYATRCGNLLAGKRVLRSVTSSASPAPRSS